jgi:hypothetical protein
MVAIARRRQNEPVMATTTVKTAEATGSQFGLSLGHFSRPRSLSFRGETGQRVVPCDLTPNHLCGQKSACGITRPRQIDGSLCDDPVAVVARLQRYDGPMDNLSIASSAASKMVKK